MAEKKISELTSATEFNDADVLAVVQGGTTKKVAKTVLLDGLIDGVAWGDITGTLSSQSDLNTALGNKADDSDLTTHTGDADIHREINDAGTGATDLWSADKIGSELNAKANLATAKGCVVHDDDANVARPSGYVSVEWIGDVEPLNAANNDTWIDTSEEGS
jgi:hypothetical protein